MKTLFYRQPRLLLLSLALIAVAGASSFALLPRAEDPSLKGRIARVVTRLPGASPEKIEQLVGDPLEDELREVPHIKLLRSTSRRGISVILIELKDQVTDPDAVWTQVRDKLDDATPRLPKAASAPDFEDMTIQAFTLISALTWEGSGAPDHAALGRLGEQLKDRLRGVANTDDVELFGKQREEIQVSIGTQTLSALGRKAADVAAAVRGADAKVAAGSLQGGSDYLRIEVTGELDSLERIRQVPIRQAPDGRVVRLGEVARVEQAVVDPAEERALVAGKPAVTVAARMLEGNRIDRWSAQVRAELEAFSAELPAEVELRTIFDQSTYTTERLNGLLWNLVLGVALVMVVMLVLMGWRSALLVGAALPLATLLVLVGMRLLEIPMHQMSVTGLIIALGLLIDNAIVMVDEVEVRLDEGLDPVGAIGGAVSHLAVPLVSSTLTTALAFMPMVLMPGPAGEFVGAIGSSVILALFSSLFLALTVIPALRGLLAGRAAPEAAEAPARWWQSGLRTPGLVPAYRRGLDWFLARPAAAVAVTALLPLLGFLAVGLLEEQFFPPSDRDMVQVELRLPSQASLEETHAAAVRAREVLLADPRVADVHWFAGRTAPKFYYNMLTGQDGSAFFAQALLQLKSADGSQAAVRELQRALDASLPKAQAVVKLLEQGPPFEAPVEMHLTGPDLVTLRAVGEELRAALTRTPDVVHTRTSLTNGQPKLWLKLDEEAARLKGLTNADVAQQLEESLSGVLGGTLLEGDEELPVRVRVEAAVRESPRGIEAMGLYGPLDASGVRHGAPVMTLGALDLAPQAAVITRRNGRRANTVQAFVTAGVLPSKVLTAFRAELERSGFELPPGYSLSVGGESDARDEAVGNLLASVGVLLVLMAATLVLSFNSFRQAAIIAGVGLLSIGLSLFALATFGSPFGFMAIVGTMGLIGVAINDAIVVLAAIRDDPLASQGDPTAVRDVVVRSTRHVVATTLTTVAGFVPLLLTGGDFWRPLAIAIAGGVAGATLLALTFVPAAFLALVRLGMVCPLRAHAPSEPASA